MVTRFWWVRHGPTHAKTFAGWRDIPADLSDTARLARLDAYLPKGALVVSSDLIRASATADILALSRHRLGHETGLREFHFGDWDGLGFAEVAQRWPDLSRRYWEQPGDIAPPRGESWNDGQARVSATVDALEKRHPGRDIIAVAHFGVILTQYQIAARLTPIGALAQSVDNLSVTCLAHQGNVWRVDVINHCP